MALNKIKSLLAAKIHGSHVKKHRQLVLRTHYLKGLSQENKLEDEKRLEARYQMIETYYQEAIAPYQRQLSGITKLDDQKTKKILKFDEKAYWARRRYKTKQAKTLDESKLEASLAQYDQRKRDERQAYLGKLEEKYPHVDLNEAELKQLQSQIDRQTMLRDARKARALAQQTKKHAQFLKLKTTIAKKVEELKQQIKLLSEKIENYNQQKVKADILRREELLQAHKGLEANHHLPLHYKQKKLDVLASQIDLIDTTNLVLEDETIHLAVSKLKMFFGGVKAVNDLSFQVKHGEIFGLIGPNGAGKTTVFNCLTQFYKATGGHMIFRNKENNVVNLLTKKTHDIIHEGIARSFQNVELIWELTVIDNLLVAAHSLLVTNFVEHMLHTKKMWREDRVLRTKGMNILQVLGIAEYAFRSPYGLPYGVLKKIELARTLMTNPSLIILDEPAAGLNDAETMELASVIKKINEEFHITIFLVEHDMGLVMSICDTVCAISFGKMIGIGTPQAIQNNPEVRTAYLGEDSDE